MEEDVDQKGHYRVHHAQCCCCWLVLFSLASDPLNRITVSSSRDALNEHNRLSAAGVIDERYCPSFRNTRSRCMLASNLGSI